MKDQMLNCNLSNLWSFWGHFFKCWHLQNHETVTSRCSAEAADCQLHDSTTFNKLLLWCVWSVFQTDGGTRHVFQRNFQKLAKKGHVKNVVDIKFLDPFPFEESIHLGFDWHVFRGNLKRCVKNGANLQRYSWHRGLFSGNAHLRGEGFHWLNKNGTSSSLENLSLVLWTVDRSLVTPEIPSLVAVTNVMLKFRHL